MKKLANGEYFGNHYNKTHFKDLVITDTEYTHAKVDWHYHENPYFTYLLQGKLFEENKKNSYYLKKGSLLFHNWQDAHYNIKPKDFTRGFHVELTDNWLEKYEINTVNLEGSLHVKNPFIKEKMNKIFFESKIKDANSQLTIEMLLIDIFSNIKPTASISKVQIPVWVNNLKEILHCKQEICTSLASLSSILNIHPVHLSREFPKYFHTTIGNYIRTQKVNKALLLITENKLSMTEICYQCGFYDQSHFITTFKKIYNHTPLQFSKKIRNVNFLQL